MNLLSFPHLLHQLGPWESLLNQGCCRAEQSLQCFGPGGSSYVWWGCGHQADKNEDREVLFGDPRTQPQSTSLCLLSPCDCSGVRAEQVHFAWMTPYSKLLWRKLTHLCSLSRKGTMSVEQLQERMAQAGEQFLMELSDRRTWLRILVTLRWEWIAKKSRSPHMFLHADFDSIYMEFLTVLTTETLTETVSTMPLYILFAKGFLCCHDIIDTTKQIMSFAWPTKTGQGLAYSAGI